MTTDTDTKHKVKSLDKPWRNWVFTWYYHSKETQQLINDGIDATAAINKDWGWACEQDIANLTEEKCKFVIYGKEKTKNGRLHMQGYIEFKNAMRMTGVKRIIDSEYGVKSKIKLIPANANREYNESYCSKGIQSHEEYDKLGEQGPNYGIDAVIYKKTFTEVNEGKGKRTDWNQLYERIYEEPDFNTILEEFPEYAIKYSNGINAAINAIHIKNGAAAANEDVAERTKDGLFDWQKELYNELKGKPHQEKIIWYVDTDGRAGKSTMIDYTLANLKSVTMFENSGTKDVACAWNGERICFFDFPRPIEERMNYGVIESIKNGRIFSAKYQSGLKRFGRPHVVCFSNFEPDHTKFSKYKWDIRRISTKDHIQTKETVEIVTPIVDDLLNISSLQPSTASRGPTANIVTSIEDNPIVEDNPLSCLNEIIPGTPALATLDPAPVFATLTTTPTLATLTGVDESRGNTERTVLASRFPGLYTLDYRGLPVSITGLPIDPNYEIETRESKKEFDAQSDYRSAYSQNYMEFL